MDKRIEYQGGVIDIPLVLKEIQSNVEKYLAEVVKSVSNGSGVIYPVSADSAETPCHLFISNRQLVVKPGKLIFPEYPYTIASTAQTVISTDIVSAFGTANTLYVYATLIPTEAGVLKRVPDGFQKVLGSPATYYDQLNDKVTFSVSTIELTGQVVKLGTLYNNVTDLKAEDEGYDYDATTGVSINQKTRTMVRPGMLPTFVDRYLTLNADGASLANATAGLIVKNGPEEGAYGSFLLEKAVGGSYKFQSSFPVAGPNPINPEDYTTKDWVTKYVTYMTTEIPKVLNFRITDIYGTRRYGLETTRSSLIAQFYDNASMYNDLMVSFKWGYDNLTGLLTDGSFTFDNADLSFTEDSLQGYYMNFPSVNGGTVAKIVNNLGKQISLTKIDGSPLTFNTPQNITSANPAWIHMKADKYQIVCTPYFGDTPVEDEKVVHEEILAEQTTTRLTTSVKLKAGGKYLIRIRGVLNGGRAGDWEELNASSYSKYGKDQNYVSPLTVLHAYLPDPPQQTTTTDSNGNTITLQGVEALSTKNGFKVAINNGWENAENYEVCYTAVGSADFKNPAHEKRILNSRSGDLITEVSARYSVKIRPLIGGQEVGTPISLTVVSGSQGTQNEQVIAQQYISLKTMSGQIVSAGADTQFRVSNLQYPANSGLAYTAGMNSLGDLIGDVITIEGKGDFLISQITYTDSFRLQPIGNASLPLDGITRSFTMNVSKRGRMIYKSNKYPIDYDIVRVDFDCDVQNGDPVTMRVYQQSNEAGYDTLPLINGSDSTYTQDVDIALSGTYGDRNLVVDLYDPTPSGKNTGCVSGLITVYALPRRDYSAPAPIQYQ